jgi:hypothetical protein
LYAAAEALQETAGLSLPSPNYQQLNHEKTIAMLRTNLGEENFAKAWAEGRSMTMEQATEHGLEGQNT